MKEKVMSLARKDFEWEYFRAGGKGGQKQNKTNSGVRCRHLPSGAVTESREHRDQLHNKREAFKRMGQDPKFLAWVRVQFNMIIGLPPLEVVVEEAMRSENIREQHLIDGKWVDA